MCFGRKEEQRVIAQCRQAADVTGPASRISPVFIKAEDEIREVQAECVFRLCGSVRLCTVCLSTCA